LWEEVWHAASSASLDFPGGEVLVSVTPAMAVIDVDGIGAPRDVAMAAVPAIARALAWFDLGGNIGIDFPTLAAKADRRAVDEALEAALTDWPHERTAMNGFGFVQLVARLEGPSLLHRFTTARLGMAARMALRRAELAADEGAGRVLLMTVHPALKAKLKDEWLTILSRRTGRVLEIRLDPTLAIETSSAQLVAA
jgi:Ribonuclease G/E